MFRKFGIVFAALALFSIAGGHWAVLQTVAWAGMLRGYTQRSGSVAVAVEQTFDGQHPCELCLRIDAAKRQEAKAQNDQQKSDNTKSGIAKADKAEKAVPFRQDLSPNPIAVAALDRNAGFASTGSRRGDQPPTPPPRP